MRNSKSLPKDQLLPNLPLSANSDTSAFFFGQIGLSVHPLAAHLSQSFTNLNVQIHSSLSFFPLSLIDSSAVLRHLDSPERNFRIFDLARVSCCSLIPRTFLVYCSFESYDLRISGLYRILNLRLRGVLHLPVVEFESVCNVKSLELLLGLEFFAKAGADYMHQALTYLHYMSVELSDMVYTTYYVYLI
ncbi:unnamed protein product [Citrullus colocynthis]|uniref:Uncharacterized protein n=1 Tax=Citrullus colocynthis TaxID=252529 RepID=A0ABP0YRS6_9ROSI